MFWDSGIDDANNIVETLEHIHRDIGQLGLFIIIAIVCIVIFRSRQGYKRAGL